MVFVSSPGRTATTSISTWFKENTDIHVLQEPFLGKIIFILNNLRYRTTFTPVFEEMVSSLLCLQLRFLIMRKKKLIYVDPFTSHSTIFRKKLFSSIKKLRTIQLTREKNSWARSMVNFEAYGFLKFLKPVIPLNSPIAKVSVKTRLEQYLCEFEYRISTQTNFKYDVKFDYDYLITDKGLDDLKNFFINMNYLTTNSTSIELAKINSSH